jgi:hypothetical protein
VTRSLKAGAGQAAAQHCEVPCVFRFRGSALARVRF